MRKILHLAWTDLKIEFSERSTLVFVILLPLVFTIVIGQGLGGMYRDEGPEDPRYPVLVVDQDASELSAYALQVLGESRVVRPLLRSLDEANAIFEEEQAAYLLVIPPGFESALLAGEQVELGQRRLATDISLLAIEREVETALGQVGSAVDIARSATDQAAEARPFPTETDRRAYFQNSLEMAAATLSEPAATSQIEVSPQAQVHIATGFEQTSPGQLVTWTMITLLGASIVFVNERQSGTLRRLLVTPTARGIIILGKMTGQLFVGLIQMAILIGVGAAFLGVNWGRSPLALVLVSLAFALAAVSLGVMLGAFARTRSQASGLTIMFSMMLGALGGAWWPLEITPPLYQSVVRLLPTTWAMMGFSDVILRGQDVTGVLPEVGMLLGFAALFFSLGALNLKFE